MLLLCCNILPQRLNCFLLKVTEHALLSKIPTWQNSYNDVLHDFQQVVFHTQNTIFVFHNVSKFIIIQKFVVTTIVVYKYHALIIRYKKITAMELQCNSFEITMW